MSGNKDQDLEDQEKFEQEMTPLMGSRSQLIYSQQKNFYLSGWAYLFIFIPTLIVVTISDDECEKPIRPWLITMAAVSGIYVLTGMLESFGEILSKVGSPGAYLMGFLALFQVVWYVIGSVWLFNDDDCNYDWGAGYVMTLVLLVVFYVEVGIFLLIICCCCCCVGIVAGIASSSEPSR